MDRISDLPKEIRHLILSLLPYHEAVATSILSTTWRYDWLYSYSLNFDHTFFKFWESYDERLWNSPDSSYRLDKSEHASVRYLDFLHEVLITRMMNYDSFRIRNLELDLSNSCFKHTYSLEINPLFVSFLDNLSSRVENLILTISTKQLLCDEIQPFFSTTKSLAVLQVKDFWDTLRHTRTLGGVISPSSCLRIVYLYSAYIKESQIETLFVNDTIIESITIDRCCGFSHLKLVGLSKLKELHLSSNFGLERVEIKRAPNLRSLYYTPNVMAYRLCSIALFNNASLTQEKLSYMSKCFIFQLPCCINELELHECDGVLKQDESCMSRLEKLRIFNTNGNKMKLDKLRLDYCRNLTHLKLVHCTMVDDWLNRNLSALEKLEVLTIEGCHQLEHISISLNHLETLSIIKCRKLEIIEINCPKLSNFKFVSYVESYRYVIYSPTFIELYVKVCLPDRKISTLLEKLRNVQYQKLFQKVEDVAIAPGNEEGRHCLPLFEVENLKLTADYMSTHDLRQLLDELLWLCPHTKKMQVTYRYRHEAIPSWYIYNVISIRFDHEEPTTLGDNCGCYAYHPINCWMHSVKNIMIEERQGFEDDDSIGKFWNSLIISWNEKLLKANRPGTLRWLLRIVAELCSSNQEVKKENNMII